MTRAAISQDAPAARLYSISILDVRGRRSDYLNERRLKKIDYHTSVWFNSCIGETF
jgi:hypothetical protein